MDKGIIIERTLTMLGNTQSYNDNSSRQYQVAEDLLNKIIQDIAKNNNFAFNQVTTKLNYYASAEPDQRTKEYKYNKPFGMLNHVKPNNIRIEGEFIYSTEPEIYLTYNRDIPFSEFPEYLNDYLRYSLAIELAYAFPQYSKRRNEFRALKEREEGMIKGNEFTGQYNYLDDVYNSTR